MTDEQRLDQRDYPMPKDGWTCFHCGETFTTWGLCSRSLWGKSGRHSRMYSQDPSSEMNAAGSWNCAKQNKWLESQISESARI